MTERFQPVWRAFGTDRDLGATLVIVHSPRSCSPRSTNLQRGIFPQQLWLSSPTRWVGTGHTDLRRIDSTGSWSF